MAYFEWDENTAVIGETDAAELNTEKPADPAPAVKNASARRTQKKHGLGKAVVALSLCCALVGGAVGAGGVLLLQDRSAATDPTNPTPPSASALLADPVAAEEQKGAQTSIRISGRENSSIQVVTAENAGLLTAAEVYEQNVDSTVGITTEITTTNYWGMQSSGAAAGSGFILTADGYILTNQHVIDGASSITVTTYDGTAYEAELVGADESNDIAVLKIEATDLKPVTLGDSDNLKVGEDVVAIGNPLGELTFSLTKGAVSALNRSVTLSNNVTMRLIQTDCAINSGNSGGALFNLYGEVVGITNAKYSSSGSSSEASIDNIGFAIPINQVRDIVTSIIEKGYISKPYIGVTVSDVSAESQSYGAPVGAAIRSVEADSPAARAGLQANDIVTAVNGENISTYTDLSDRIADGGVGTVLLLTVYRQGETLTLTVTVGERIQSALPEQTESQSSAAGQQEGSYPWGGGSEGGSGNPWGWSFGG